ncbi:uncharacterized protein PG998_000903 [Apiospora kogelbergensis]|uniref:uncharacterized protein n=1 Tax=Apiospora kogelbergensis TaxID=1337665 RepID=UPI003132175A
MADDNHRQSDAPGSQHEAEQHETINYFSHGDQEGVTHLENLFQLVQAESDVLPSATRDRLVAAISGIAASQFHAIHRCRQQNLHELVQVNRSCPTGHGEVVVAIRRFRDAQHRLWKLEERLVDQFDKCALHVTLGRANTPTPAGYGSEDSGSVTSLDHNLLDDFTSLHAREASDHPHGQSQAGTVGATAIIGYDGSDLILFEDSSTGAKLEITQAAPGDSPAEERRPTSGSTVWHDPEKLEELRVSFKRVPSGGPGSHTGAERPMVVVPAGGSATPLPEAPAGNAPHTGRLEARHQTPEIMLPNEDIIDRLYDTEYQRQHAIQLRTDTNLRDVLAVVRGGKILRATIVQLHGISDSWTAMVQFANWRHAHIYSDYAKAHDITVHGRKCAVVLANTPSYPMASATMNSLEQGSTRCVEIKGAPVEELGTYFIRLRRWFSRVQDALEDVVLYLEENKLVLRFKDLDFATKAHRLAKNGGTLFPTLCNVVEFAADPCAEPVATLNESSAMADEGICLMDVVDNHDWNIQTAYPGLCQNNEHRIDDTSEFQSPPVAGHAPGHASEDSTESKHLQQVPPARSVADQIHEDQSNWFTDEEYLEMRGFTAYLRDPKEWKANVRYWVGRTRKDLKAPN